MMSPLPAALRAVVDNPFPVNEYVYRVRFRVMTTSRWKVCSIGRLKAILLAHPNSDIEIERSTVEWKPVGRNDL